MAGPADQSTGGQADWPMLALSWLMYFAFSLTAASMAPIVGTVRRELGLSYTQVGLVLGGWQLVYLAAALPVGLLVDRFDTRRVLFAGAVIVGASQVARSFATDFWTLFLAVALLGVGGPVMSVGLPKVIAGFFTGPRRSTASGIYVTGAHLGQMTALAGTVLVVAALGDWRLALRWYGALVIVIALVWLRAAKPLPVADTEPGQGTWEGMRQVATAPGFWLVVAVGFAGFLGSHGYRNWLPELLAARGMTPERAGLTAALPALAGMVGSVVVLHVCGRGHRRVPAMILLAVVGASMVGATVAQGPLLLVVIGLEGFCAGALMPLMMNTLMELPSIGPRSMGVAAGIYFTVGELGGFAGPVLVGTAVGATGSFTVGVLLLAGVMWLAMFAAAKVPATSR